MRNRIKLFALVSMMMSLCIPASAQQPQTPVQGVVANTDDSIQLKKETRAVTPKDRGLVIQLGTDPFCTVLPK
jgi:hypothetical protein